MQAALEPPGRHRLQVAASGHVGAPPSPARPANARQGRNPGCDASLGSFGLANG